MLIDCVERSSLQRILRIVVSVRKRELDARGANGWWMLGSVETIRSSTSFI